MCRRAAHGVRYRPPACASGRVALRAHSAYHGGASWAPGVAARMFGTLAERGINIISITTSEILITCLIEESRLQEAARALHTAFELDE